MKIKTKKQMNLPQLIEWAWDNEIKDRIFLSDSYCVGFDRHGYIYFNSQLTIPPNKTFTLEVEEEITEDTMIPKIVSIGRKNENEINIHHYCRISQFIDNKDFNYYVLNDDDTLTLIWCDGKLIKE